MIRIFNITVTRSVLLLLISEAILLYLCYLLGALLSPLYQGPEIYLLDDGGLWQIGFLVVIVMLGLYLQDLYEDFRSVSVTILGQQFCLALGGAFLLQAILGYAKIDLQVPKWSMVIGSVLVLIAAPLWRKVYAGLVRNSLPTRKLIFLGTSPTSLQIMGQIRQAHLDMSVLGYIDAEPHPEAADARYLGTPDMFESLVAAHKPDCIVVGMQNRRNTLPVQQLLDLRFAGIMVEDAGTTYETVFHRVSTQDLRPSQMVFSGALSPPVLSLVLQNVYSFVLASAGLLVALPVMVIVAVLVKATSKGPVLFRQRRVGLNGVPFFLYKFRSMRVDAEAQTGPVWASKNDPRVTRIGGWLRRTRLDELPQLFNVIRLEMSLVGPRPERPEFVSVLSEKIPFFSLRHAIKPGITGWAQINHKYGDTIEDTVVKLEYDLYYIKNLTMALDALIMFHTVKVILLQRGSQ